MQPVEPIQTAHLFPGLHEALMALLRGLPDEAWLKPTAAGVWRVRDVAAHLIDGNVRQIAFRRDRLAPLDPEFPIRSYADLVRFIDGLNAVWVKAFDRTSPRLLVEMLELTGPPVSEIFAGLDPDGPAIFGVAWAGEISSSNWFDTAREYTERWHHQQQIRDAVCARPLTGREWLHPVIDTFLRALPHHYREVAAPEGTHVAFEITGEAGGCWVLRREAARWTLHAGDAAGPAARVRADQDTTWRLLTRGLRPEEAAGRVRFEGREDLGRPFLHVLAIMG
jgi:uncharacterized protein (TIGR03083 family)